jgi:hypothetical protein
MGDYDVTAARGFIDLFGLPMKLSGKRQARIDGADGARAPSRDPAA